MDPDVPSKHGIGGGRHLLARLRLIVAELENACTWDDPGPNAISEVVLSNLDSALRDVLVAKQKREAGPLRRRKWE